MSRKYSKSFKELKKDNGPSIFTVPTDPTAYERRIAGLLDQNGTLSDELSSLQETLQNATKYNQNMQETIRGYEGKTIMHPRDV